MPTEFDTPQNFQISGLPELPDDVTLAEMNALMLGHPIMRGGVVVVDKLDISEQQINDILVQAGIDLGDADDIYGDDE